MCVCVCVCVRACARVHACLCMCECLCTGVFLHVAGVCGFLGGVPSSSAERHLFRRGSHGGQVISEHGRPVLSQGFEPKGEFFSDRLHLFLSLFWVFFFLGCSSFSVKFERMEYLFLKQKLSIIQFFQGRHDSAVLHYT